MKILLLVLIFLPGLAYSQTPVTEIDTATSRTMLYAAMNSKNTLYKRDEYEIETEDILFTGMVLKRLSDGTITKGCRLYGNSVVWQNNGIMGYMDDYELDGIVSTLKYLMDSIDLQKRPQQDTWIYYKTVDDFEIGARAAKGKKFEIYFRKNYRVLINRFVSIGKFSLPEAYKSFVFVRDFLKSH